MRLHQVHYAPSSTIVMPNADHVGYSQETACRQVGDTLATDRLKQVTCRRCLKKTLTGQAVRP